MNSEQANALLKRLRAAYPAATVTDDTVRLYLSELRRMDFDTGNNAVHHAIESCRFMPSIAELREQYAAERERRRRLNDEEQRRLENRAYDDMPRPPLREIPAVRAFGGPIDPGLEREGTGECGYCQARNVALFRLGKFQICASCAGRARRAGEACRITAPKPENSRRRDG